MGHAAVASPVALLELADRLQQPAIVEPVDPFQCRELDGLERPPRPTSMDDLGLVETVDGLGQSVVVTVADAAHRRLDTGVGRALGVFDRYVLGGFAGRLSFYATSLRFVIFVTQRRCRANYLGRAKANTFDNEPERPNR